MLPVSFYCRNAVGSASSFFNSTYRDVVGNSFQQEQTLAVVNQVAKEIVKAQAANAGAIFAPEIREFVPCSSFLDPCFYNSVAVEEKSTFLPSFELPLFEASESEIYDAMKLAIKNDDLERVKKFLPRIKDKEKTLDALFADCKHTTKFSLDIITALLPLCSTLVQKEFLNEMVRQDNSEAVQAILSFYNPHVDQGELAAFRDIPNISPETKERFVSSLPGKTNFLSNPVALQNIIETGREAVLPITKKTALQVIEKLPFRDSGRTVIFLDEDDSHFRGEDLIVTSPRTKQVPSNDQPKESSKGKDLVEASQEAKQVPSNDQPKESSEDKDLVEASQEAKQIPSNEQPKESSEETALIDVSQKEEQVSPNDQRKESSEGRELVDASESSKQRDQNSDRGTQIALEVAVLPFSNENFLEFSLANSESRRGAPSRATQVEKLNQIFVKELNVNRLVSATKELEKQTEEKDASESQPSFEKATPTTEKTFLKQKKEKSFLPFQEMKNPTPVELETVKIETKTPVLKKPTTAEKIVTLVQTIQNAIKQQLGLLKHYAQILQRMQEDAKRRVWKRIDAF